MLVEKITYFFEKISVFGNQQKILVRKLCVLGLGHGLDLTNIKNWSQEFCFSYRDRSIGQNQEILRSYEFQGRGKNCVWDPIFVIEGTVNVSQKNCGTFPRKFWDFSHL